MFIKPAINPETGEPFRILIPPHHQVMPPEGREVGDNDMHWLWMLRHGDVVEAEPPVEEQPATGESEHERDPNAPLLTHEEHPQQQPKAEA